MELDTCSFGLVQGNLSTLCPGASVPQALL